MKYYRLKAISSLAFTEIVIFYMNLFKIKLVDEMQKWFVNSLNQPRLTQSDLGSIVKRYILYELFKNSSQDPFNPNKDSKEILFPVEVQAQALNSKAIGVKTENLVMKNYRLIYFE